MILRMERTHSHRMSIRKTFRLPNRGMSAALVVAAVMVASVIAGAGTAWAQVTVDADHPVRGEYAILTFEVPNESDTGALTIQLRVTLPNVESASTEVMSGWSARLDRDTTAGTTRSVTWTAAPRGGIPPHQFALFRLSVKLPDSETVSLPATQTYSDGTVVRWDQPPLRGGGEPEHPAPMLTLTTAPSSSTAALPTTSTSDYTARKLAGAAIAVGAVGLALATVAFRRRT